MKNPGDLVNLIKSLTGPEKRYFKVFVAKNSIGEGNHYVKLFDLINKTGSSERKDIEKLYANEDFMNKQFRPYKHFLYEQILNSLAAYYSKASVDDKILEMIRKAKILYDKTLFSQAEILLEKAKTIALKYENYTLLLEIMRWKKKIIAASSSTQKEITENDINQLAEEEKAIIHKIDNAVEYWNIKILLYFSYKTNGPARTQEDVERYDSLINSPTLKKKFANLPYHSKYDLYSIYILYYGAVKNIRGAYEYCKRQLTLMDAHPHQINEDINQYITALYNLLFATQYLKNYEEFFELIPKLKLLCNDIQMGINESMRNKVQLFACHLEFRAYVMTGQFKKAMNFLPEIDEVLKEQKNKNEGIELQIILNKAMLYLGKGNYKNALACTNTILNKKNNILLQEDYILAKIIQLLIHFEKGNMDLLSYLIKSVYRYLLQKKQLYKAENILIHFIRINEIKTPKDQIEAFKILKEELDSICNDPLEAIYLENSYLIPLLESKIKNKPLEEILREKSGYVMD